MPCFSILNSLHTKEEAQTNRRSKRTQISSWRSNNSGVKIAYFEAQFTGCSLIVFIAWLIFFANLGQMLFFSNPIRTQGQNRRSSSSKNL